MWQSLKGSEVVLRIRNLTIMVSEEGIVRVVAKVIVLSLTPSLRKAK